MEESLIPSPSDDSSGKKGTVLISLDFFESCFPIQSVGILPYSMSENPEEYDLHVSAWSPAHGGSAYSACLLPTVWHPKGAPEDRELGVLGCL